MKRNNLNVVSKPLAMAVLACSFVAFTTNPNTPASDDPWGHLVNEDIHEVQLNGNTLTYGSHVYTVNGDIEWNGTYFKTPTAYVTFTNIPSGYNEFEAVYNNLLGKTPQGVAAMVPMAMEIYGRNNETGMRCFQLICNGPSTVNQIVNTLKTKYPKSSSSQHDSYLQRYLPAALLKGAVNTNAYTPEEPYTVEMCRSANAPADAPLTGGTVYYVYILAHGWDTFQRSIEIFQPYGTEKYQLFNCPAAYTQCKNIIGTWQGLK